MSKLNTLKNILFVITKYSQRGRVCIQWALLIKHKKSIAIYLITSLQRDLKSQMLVTKIDQ